MNDICAVAVAEVLTPTLPMLRQLLEVHSITQAEGRPAVQHVADGDNNTHHVYFAVDGQPYFIVICLVSQPNGLEPVGAYTTPAVRVHLLVHSERLSPLEISEWIGLDPTRSEPRGHVPRSGALARRDHLWDFEPEKGMPGSLASKLQSLLKRLELHAERIADLASTGSARVTVAVCYEDSRCLPSGFDLTSDLIAQLHHLSCSLWFDPYSSGPDFLS